MAIIKFTYLISFKQINCMDQIYLYEANNDDDHCIMTIYYIDTKK